jgi:hypothetical protein
MEDAILNIPNFILTFWKEILAMALFLYVYIYQVAGLGEKTELAEPIKHLWNDDAKPTNSDLMKMMVFQQNILFRRINGIEKLLIIIFVYLVLTS